MKVRFKKLHPHAVIPKYANPGDNGLDLVAISKEEVKNPPRGMLGLVCDGPMITNLYVEYDTGISVEIPEGHVGLVFPRSSISKKSMMLRNHVGVVDSSYRGTIKLRFGQMAFYPEDYYEIGDKIGQLVIVPAPTIEVEEVEEREDLSDTGRGSDGFGSTDTKA